MSALVRPSGCTRCWRTPGSSWAVSPRRCWGLGPGDAGGAVGGTTDPEVLAELARGQLRKKLPALREALQGQHLDYLEEAIERLSGEVAWVIAPFSPLLGLLMTIPGWSGGPLGSSWPRSGPT